jgi:phospholipase C
LPGGRLDDAIQPRRARAADTPIEHIIIACQENRSFDHYFGYAPQVQARASGRRPASASRTRRDARPGRAVPLHGARDAGHPHDWDSVHGQWDNGAMDGFMTHSGINAMGYYTEQELPFYYGLFEDSTLCANMFCSLLGPTWPNRFYLMAGTSGGITTNGQWGYGIFDTPMILDLLDAPASPGRSTTSAGTACRSATPTTSRHSGRSTPTTTGPAATGVAS